MGDKSMLTKVKEYIIGTPEQNAEATAKLKAMKSMDERFKEQEQNDAAQYFGLKKGEGASWDNKETKPVTKKKGGVVSSASARADGCAIRGKTKGRMV